MQDITTNSHDMPEIQNFSPVLALELASGLTPPTEVFSRHGVDKTVAAKMLAHPIFQKMIREAKAEWDAVGNAEERIRVKSRLALEELLPDHFYMATAKNTPATARNEAVKIIKSLAGMDKRADGEVGPTERFVVNINLGEADTQKVSITADVPTLQRANDDEE